MKPINVASTLDFLDGIRARREQLGMTQLELDDHTGLTPAHTGKIEHGNAPWAKAAFRLTNSALWIMLGLDLRLVLMTREDAEALTGEGVLSNRARSYKPRGGTEYPTEQRLTMQMSWSVRS